MDAKELGDLGEKLACEYLVGKGYKILVRNYRINFGEIDIIASKRPRFFVFGDKTIHFVEVKTLAGNSDGIGPEEHVNAKKKRKLRQLAEIWLEKNRFSQNHPYKIDVIGISMDSNAHSGTVVYFENAIEDLPG